MSDGIYPSRQVVEQQLTEARATIERLETEVKRMTTERDEARRVARVWQNEMAEEQRRHNAEAMEVQSEARATIERLRRAIKQSHGKQDHGPTCYLCAALAATPASEPLQMP